MFQLLKTCFVIEAAEAVNIETKNQEKERKSVMSLKHNKHFRRIAAALMAGTMMVSMFGMTAFAKNGDISAGTENNVLIKKTLEKGVNVYTPDTAFTFRVTAGEADDKGEDGVPGAILNGGEVVIDFTPEENESSLAEKSVVKTSETGFNFDADAFEHAGIYHYVVEEEEGSYDGITYATDGLTRDLYVYVENTTDEEGDPGLQIAGYEMWNGKAKSEGFTNKYVTGGSEFDKESLKVTKEVTGKMGDLKKEFNFTITVSDNTENVTEMYYMVVNNESGVNMFTLTDNTAQPFVLAHGDTAVIYGLSASDTYTITETPVEGYNTKINGTEGNEIANKTISDAAEVTFVNESTAFVPETGLILNVAPYVLMVVLAGGLAFLFLRRRKDNF